MNGRDRMSDYIDTHPKEMLTLLTIGLFCLWQSVVGLLGVILYFLLKRLSLGPWMLLSMGILSAMIFILFQQVNLSQFIYGVFTSNITFCKYLLINQPKQAFSLLYPDIIGEVLGFSPLLAGLMSLIDCIHENPHGEAMQALQEGMHVNTLPELKEKDISRALKKYHDKDFEGTFLGVSKYSGLPSVISDHSVNHVVLLLGTTGSGKTMTLRRFYQRAIVKKYPLIVIDGKPDDANIAWLKNLADQHERQFFGFNCANYLSYDCLSQGSYTELKDKIISLKDGWSSDHYRSIAEDYLQTTLEVLIKSGKKFDLKKVVYYLNYEDLTMLVRDIQDQTLMKRVSSLEHYDRSDITGLQAHLNILIHSELGQFFEINKTTFHLRQAIDQCAVVYFALPALRFPSFYKVGGKLVINDLKTVVDRNNHQPIFTIFDEFSIFAGEQVLNLVNMGRGKGVHAVFGTQGLADLKKIDETFKNQMLNCANTLICHRLNDQESAEDVANWIGTQDDFTVTAQINPKESDAGLGSVRYNKAFIVHPDAIKQELQTGEAFYVSKVGRFQWDKVRVKY